MAVRKNILFFSHAADFGGAEKSLADILCRLDQQLYAPAVLLLDKGPLADELDGKGFQVSILETPEEILATRRSQFFTPGNIRDSFSKAMISRQVIRAVAEHAKSISADLIYTNSSKAHVLGGFAGKKSKIPVMWHIRDYFNARHTVFFYYWVSRFTASCVVCNSRFTATQFKKRRNVHVIYSGIDPEKVKPTTPAAEVRASLGIPEAAPVIGMAGRLDHWKGHRVFLRAAARMAEDVRDARFLIVGAPIYGDEAYEEHLKKLADDYGISKNVIFTGFREDVYNLLNIMDVYVHPSEEPEPYGRGIVEAMLLGKPVVASGEGGPEEIVRHAETGILVDPGDSVALARAAIQLVDNPEVSSALGGNGLTRAKEFFTLDKTSEKLHEVLSQVLR